MSTSLLVPPTAELDHTATAAPTARKARDTAAKEPLPSYKFDYTAMATGIADQMHAAADHVYKLQRSALIEIGRRLSELKDQIDGEQFVGWVERQSKIPAWLAQHAMDAAGLPVAAGLLASTAEPNPVSGDIAERAKRPRNSRNPKNDNRAAILPIKTEIFCSC